jgi:hypothetical protein
MSNESVPSSVKLLARSHDSRVTVGSANLEAATLPCSERLNAIVIKIWSASFEACCKSISNRRLKVATPRKIGSRHLATTSSAVTNPISEAVQALGMRAGIVGNVTQADRDRLDAIVSDRSAPQKQVWRTNIIDCRPKARLAVVKRGKQTLEALHRSGRSPSKLRPPAGAHPGAVGLSDTKGVRQTKQARNNNQDRYVSVSKHDATRAEYDRFGGVGIAHGQAIRIPGKVIAT